MSDQRLSPKEIKRDIREDEVGLFLSSAVERAYENRGLLAKIGMALVALVILAIGYGAYAEHSAKVRAQELVDAMEVFSAPVDGDTEAADGDGPTFADDAARRAAARAKLEAVKGGAAKDVAGLYLADLAVADGDLDTARSIWQRFVDNHGDHLLAQSARLNLISLDRDAGRGDEVVANLERELDKSSSALPEDVILFELGRTLEVLDRDEDAKTYFQRLVDEHASSPYTPEARQRLEDPAAASGINATTSFTTGS